MSTFLGVRLSVLPLPVSLLGPAARSLPLEADSGSISNKNELAVASPLYPNRGFYIDARPTRGRVGGYALDYGLGESGGAGVTEVWTSVERYKTKADAKRGLVNWRLEDSQFDPFGGPTLSATTSKEKAAPVGDGHFAVLIAYSTANIAPLFGFDEQFTLGRYEADVTVWAGSVAAAQELTPRLAKKLDARIKRALAGRLQAKPVGPAPQLNCKGRNLAPLELQTTDLSGQADTTQHSGPSSQVSVCVDDVQMKPAGQFQNLEQFIVWYPTANAASFESDNLADVRGPRGLDLSNIGDGAWGGIDYSSRWDQKEAVLEFPSSQILEVVLGGSPDIQEAQAVALAQIVANRINAAGVGS
jgi:hypothetical protein